MRGESLLSRVSPLSFVLDKSGDYFQNGFPKWALEAIPINRRGERTTSTVILHYLASLILNSNFVPFLSSTDLSLGIISCHKIFHWIISAYVTFYVSSLRVLLLKDFYVISKIEWMHIETKMKVHKNQLYLSWYFSIPTNGKLIILNALQGSKYLGKMNLMRNV